jgi:hypothetical protein
VKQSIKRKWFDRRSMFTDLGELDHVIYLFGQYQRWPDDCAIASMERGGPWVILIERLREYLDSVGFRDAARLTASDCAYRTRFESQTDIRSAVNCLSLLLSHYRTHHWTDDAVDDLRGRLTIFYAILSERDAQPADRSRDAARGPRKRKAPKAEKILAKDEEAGREKALARATELAVSPQYVNRVRSRGIRGKP